jgi:hypothetical protein
VSQDQLPIITIDLNDIQRKTVNKESLIQKHVYEALNERVKVRLKSLESLEKVLDANKRLPSGMGWVSFIDGTRGAGKSTFLHIALNLLEEDYKNQLAVMDWIDPSRIETNEILLLVFLKTLNDKVTHELDGRDQSEQKRSEKDEWKKVFKSVAGALVLFQNGHHPLNELDEDLFFEIGLEQAGHSTKLRENLNTLFSKACKILGVKALLFAFDDADTSAHCAIDLLETIRKYLDTPRVMIVITGDLELYSLLVRQNFRNELARGKRDEWGTEGFAGGRVMQQMRMLDHLEEQYLLKLFPLSERHHLFPLWRLSDDSGNRKAVANFKLITRDQNGGDLKNFTREQIQKGFRLTTESDITLYTEYLLMQPVRSVLEVLSRIQEGENTLSNNDFSLAIQDLAMHNFYHYNIAAEELAAEDFRALVEAVYEVAMDDGDPDTSAYLRPVSSQLHNRGAMYGLSAAVVQQLRGKPSACISYLLRGPGMVKLAQDATHSNLRKLDEKELLREFKRYMGVGRNDDALGWARLATVALVSEHAIAQNIRVVRYGIVGLNQESGSGYKGFGDVFAIIAKNNNKTYPAAAFSLVNSSGTGTRTFASIYNVLGLMGRLLTLVDTLDWNSLSEEKKKEKILNKLSGFHPNTNSISVPPWIAVTSTDNEESSNEKEEEEEDADASHQAWGSLLMEWLNAAQWLAPHIAPSSVFMGKVWPRLFFGLENISDALRPIHSIQSPRDFATLMELFALCVVNAFLAEESNYHLTTTEKKELPPIDLNNPRSSAAKYLKQLDSKGKDQISAQRLPLTFIVATCPLITGFISSEKVNTGDLWPFRIDLDVGKTYTPINFICETDWALLKDIAIQGRKHLQTSNASNKHKATERGTNKGRAINKTQNPNAETTSDGDGA